jgi:hypothetical protein
MMNMMMSAFSFFTGATNTLHRNFDPVQKKRTETVNQPIMPQLKGKRERFWFIVIALRPHTPKHIRGGWSHYTDSERTS